MTGAAPFRYIAGAYIHDMTVDVTIKGDDVDLSGCGYDYEATGNGSYAAKTYIG